MVEGSNIWRGGELVLDQLTGGVHVGEGSWGKSESVVWTKKSSNESLSLGFVDLTSSVVIVLLSDAVEVSSDILVNLILILIIIVYIKN